MEILACQGELARLPLWNTVSPVGYLLVAKEALVTYVYTYMYTVCLFIR